MKNYKSKLITIITAGLLFSSTVYANTEIIEPNGLDQIKNILQEDERLNKKVDASSITMAINSIEKMNLYIKEAIQKEGLVNDDYLSIADVREINEYLVNRYSNEWHILRGNKDEMDGYYAVERKGARTVILNRNAVDNVWAKVYDLGFPAYDKHRLSSENGAKSISFTEVGTWLYQLMQNDIKEGKLKNENIKEFKGDSNSALDGILEQILNDKGLERKVSTSDLMEGLEASNEMNKLIIEAVLEEGLGNDGKLTTADIRQINNYLVENYSDAWHIFHGDDENDLETGFHLIQNDGASSRMFADNIVNSIADGMYHLGFKTNKKNRLVNEDGKGNKSFEKVAWWLDTILKDDLVNGSLNNNDYEEVVGTTGTTFDLIIPQIYKDEGLLLKVSMEDIREGARSANGMNELIVEAIRETDIADDDSISIEDVKLINKYLVANYKTVWSELHGDDEGEEETGFHRIQNDGARSIVDNRNLINSLADSIYHLGFETTYKYNLANEDGNKNASFRTVAYWLNKYLKSDLEKGVYK